MNNEKVVLITGCSSELAENSAGF